MVTFRTTTFNQRDEAVQHCTPHGGVSPARGTRSLCPPGPLGLSCRAEWNYRDRGMSAPSNGNAVEYFVDRHEREGRGACVCRDPWRSLSYGELAEATRRFAGALRAAGIAREQRVVLLLLDTIDFPIAFWGAIRAGVVPVPINTLLTHEMVGYILADSRADARGDFRAVGRAVAAGAAQRAGAAPDHRVVQPDGAAAAAIDDARAGRVRRVPRRRRSGHADRGDAGGRGGVLAVLVGLDRRAEGRAPRARQSARDRRHLRRAGAADPARRRDVLGGEGVPCLWARQLR